MPFSDQKRTSNIPCNSQKQAAASGAGVEGEYIRTLQLQW